MDKYIIPDWPAPDRVCAAITTRACGNLADYAGIESDNVLANRWKIRQELKLPDEPIWLQQVHGIGVVCADDSKRKAVADAAFTNKSNVICAVLTADCLPVLLCDRNSSVVAAIHCGWKSLSNGIIEITLKKIGVDGRQILAWLGPAIGKEAFEVGEDVYNKFVQYDSKAALAFQSKSHKKWFADIYLLAKQRLGYCGVNNIYGGGFCTYTENERFFSYRREGEKAGRMASLIWLK